MLESEFGKLPVLCPALDPPDQGVELVLDAQWGPAAGDQVADQPEEQVGREQRSAIAQDGGEGRPPQFLGVAVDDVVVDGEEVPYNLRQEAQRAYLLVQFGAECASMGTVADQGQQRPVEMAVGGGVVDVGRGDIGQVGQVFGCPAGDQLLVAGTQERRQCGAQVAQHQSTCPML